MGYICKLNLPNLFLMEFTYFTRRRRISLIVVTSLSFVISLWLELYVFGTPEDFFVRWIRTFFVLFFMLSLTVFGIVPLVNKISKRWLR